MGNASVTVLTVKSILEGNDSFPDLSGLQDLTGKLKAEQQFGLARKLLEQATSSFPNEVWVTQQKALSTYKDEELPTRVRLLDALSLLEGIGLQDKKNNDSETLCLGGAVYKRLWEHGGQMEHLMQSLAFYRAAHERNPEQDQGYGGNNAAFILDLIAARTITVGDSSSAILQQAGQFRQDAKTIREQVRDLLLAAKQRDKSLTKKYWFLVTLAEAHLGLGEYKDTGVQLKQILKLAEADEWKLQSTFKQLVMLVRNQGVELPDVNAKPTQWDAPWQAINHLLGSDETPDALACYRGKVGLALSGGGFRASFYHLGVLARLAEIDALRDVEVLSTVSGGSILGAQYYLEVQRLLERPDKKNQPITQQDYCDLVVKLQKDFLEGVQTNIRMSVFDDFIDNVKMLFSKSYSRSHRLGNLYESNLYSKVDDGRSGSKRTMPDLIINPVQGKYQGKDFKPKYHNWRRRAKAPVLLLNTTSLNSGHNWFFTASWMGEPPGLLGDDIDMNQRYRRLYYKQAPKEDLKKFRLGHAAAASSCVPGLFEPLVLDGLFSDKTIRLVDGGVHDNQGVQGLLDEGCTLILCSDCSGQMGDSVNPASDPGGVLMRTSSILQDRVREVEYQDLKGRLNSQALTGLFFVHAKKDLEQQPLDWINCQDPSPQIEDQDMTSYGIAKDLQKSIASIRTDLDSFSEVEANALMASGYLMSCKELENLQAIHEEKGGKSNWGGFNIHAPRKKDWEFLKLEELLKEPDSENASSARKDLKKQLDVASKLFFKAWFLSPELKFVSKALLATVVIILASLLLKDWETTVFTISWGGLAISILAFFVALMLPALAWLNPQEEARSIVIKVAIALTGYIMAKLHLWIFDPRFLKRGKLAALLKLNQ